jgi:Ca2+-binding RTX toxin-like protein
MGRHGSAPRREPVTRSRRRSRPPVRFLVAALFAALAVMNAAPALASSAYVDSGTLYYIADSGEVNNATMAYRTKLTAASYVVTDPGAPLSSGLPVTIRAGNGCTSASATEVRCAARGVTTLLVNVVDQDDSVTVNAPTAAVVYGSGGNDLLSGGSGADELYGDAGNDELHGNLGNDMLRGGPPAATKAIEDNDTLDGGLGDDALYGGLGRDKLLGGPGPSSSGTDDDTLSGEADWDSADYSGHAAPTFPDKVCISLDDLANDGLYFSAGCPYDPPEPLFQAEADNVMSDVEAVTGTTGTDSIRGSNASNTIVGSGGSDYLYGYGGNDLIVSNDGIFDYAECGDGTSDTVRADTLDNVAADCENVSRSG